MKILIKVKQKHRYPTGVIPLDEVITSGKTAETTMAMNPKNGNNNVNTNRKIEKGKTKIYSSGMAK